MNGAPDLPDNVLQTAHRLGHCRVSHGVGEETSYHTVVAWVNAFPHFIGLMWLKS